MTGRRGPSTRRKAGRLVARKPAFKSRQGSDVLELWTDLASGERFVHLTLTVDCGVHKTFGLISGPATLRKLAHAILKEVPARTKRRG